jgi:hypothetical protein
MSWKPGQCPKLVWLSRKDIGAKVGRKGGGTRLMLGDVQCWTLEPLHKPDEYVCYRLVPIKPSRRAKP